MKRKEIEKIIEKHIKIKEKYNFDETITFFDDLDFGLEDYNNLFKDDKKEVLNTEFNPSLFYRLFSFPMLVLHELMHFLMVLVVLFEIPNLYLSNPIKEFYGEITHNASDNYIKNILVSVAPFLIIILSIVLPFINLYFLIFTLYTLYTWRIAIPSEQDIRDINISLIGKKLMAYEIIMINDVITGRE